MTNSKPAYTLREATPDDALILEGLFRQLGYEIDASEIEQNFALIAPSNAFHAVVAEKEGQIVGFAGLQFLHWLHRVDPVARLTALVIDERHRGQGIGQLLVDHVEQFATKAGCRVLEVSSSNYRAKSGTHDFYFGLGYQDTAGKATYFLKELVSSED
ncbi:MAG: hypothetical protein CMM48_00040 [Rhodospirillaceae bacterium]|nr:hypothetical protein [Rhodospirillaceae bacterium]HAA93251.1 hypothetical protein [Rhodospirillaceae bacterium]